MWAREVIQKLNEEKTVLTIDNGVLLRPVEDGCTSSRWIRYHVPGCNLADVHYELSWFRNDIQVSFHDERAQREDDEIFRKKLKEIAEHHASTVHAGEMFEDGQYEIMHVHEVHGGRGFIEIQKDVEDCLRDLHELFGTFLSKVIPLLATCETSELRMIAEFPVNEFCLSREVVARLYEEKIPIEVGNGVSLKYLSGEEDNGVSGPGYSQYHKDRFGRSVHYEIIRSGAGLDVALHDERGCFDALRDNLEFIAKKNLLKIEETDWGCFAITSREAVRCCRGFEEVRSDLAAHMRRLYDLFEPTLEKAALKGIESLPRMTVASLSLPEMKDIPEAEDGVDLVRAGDIRLSGRTLTWVTSVDKLFQRKIIEDSNGLRISAGHYVIPEYQRKYKWTSRQVGRLCQDLLMHAEKDPYHLGTLIFHHENGTFYVVDGQQRLRTISRILDQSFFDETAARIALEQKFTTKDELTIYSVLCDEYTLEERNVIRETLKRSTFVCISVPDVAESFQLFSTQNGRGKPLSPTNLLKAYHLHEFGDSQEEPESYDDLNTKKDPRVKFDQEWELLGAQKTHEGERLLQQVIGEHLYRLRCWIRGEFPKKPFSCDVIDAFKGMTLSAERDSGVPFQNLSVLRNRFGRLYSSKDSISIAKRTDNDGMNAFVLIDQPIVNGLDFFEYVKTYANAYCKLFDDDAGLTANIRYFREFYKKNCCDYLGAGRCGDGYARHVYQSLCLYCFDRFGDEGLRRCARDLYCCAYLERAIYSRCYYVTCGFAYAVKAVRKMSGCLSIPALQVGLHELVREIKESYAQQLRAGNAIEGQNVIRRVYLCMEGESNDR